MYTDAIIEIFKRDDGSYLISLSLFEICFALGVVACLALASFLMARTIDDKKARRSFFELAILSVVAGYYSAILFQGIYNLIATGSFGTGMTFYGGLIGGVAVFLAVLYLLLPKSYASYLPQAVEIAAPCITIAHAFGRVGCFFGGCCYGKPTSSFLGVHFEGVAGKVLPTNLMEAIFLFALTGVLVWLVYSKRRWALLTYLYAYGAFRFTIEFWRGDYRGQLLPILSPSQWWSLVLLAGAVALTIYRLMAKKRAQAAAPNSHKD